MIAPIESAFFSRCSASETARAGRVSVARTTSPPAAWHRFEIVPWHYTVTYLHNSTAIATVSLDASTIDRIRIRQIGYDGDSYIDNVYVRPYVENEPTAMVGNETTVAG